MNQANFRHRTWRDPRMTLAVTHHAVLVASADIRIVYRAGSAYVPRWAQAICQAASGELIAPDRCLALLRKAKRLAARPNGTKALLATLDLVGSDGPQAIADYVTAATLPRSPKATPASLVERRAARAQRALAEAESDLRLAQKRVAKWQRKVAYYLKKAAKASSASCEASEECTS